MAVGTPTILAFSFNTTDASAYSTASFTPTANAKLIAVVCVGHRTVTPSFPSSMANHGTWSKITDFLTSNSTWNISVWETTASGSPSANDIDIGLGATAETCCWFVFEATDAQVAQFKTLATSAANPSLTLDNAISSGGVVVGFLLNNNNTTTITEGSGYTALGTQQNSGTAPVFKLAGEYDMTGTTTVNYTASGTVVRGLVGLELIPAGVTHNQTPSDTVGVTDSIATTIKKGFTSFFVGLSDAVFITLKKSFSDNVGVSSSASIDTGEPPLELGSDMSLVDQKRAIIQAQFGLTDDQAARLTIMDMLHNYWGGDFPALHTYDGSESGLPLEKNSTMDHHAVVEKTEGGILNWIRDVI